MIIPSTPRDFMAFKAAKLVKREPMLFKAKAAACARYIPSSARGFENFRAACRGVGDWGQASERLDALEHALRARHQVGLPVPRKVIQNEDRSLSLFWEGVMVRCFVDGFTSLIGGTAGVPSRVVTNELLDLLQFQGRIQRSA